MNALHIHPARTAKRLLRWRQVTGIFGSSMEVLISVHGETPAARELVHCGSAYATVVSVNHDGDPVPVPFYVAPVSDVEKLRCQVHHDEPLPHPRPKHAATMRLISSLADNPPHQL